MARGRRRGRRRRGRRRGSRGNPLLPRRFALTLAFTLSPLGVFVLLAFLSLLGGGGRRGQHLVPENAHALRVEGVFVLVAFVVVFVFVFVVVVLLVVFFVLILWYLFVVVFVAVLFLVLFLVLDLFCCLVVDCGCDCGVGVVLSAGETADISTSSGSSGGLAEHPQGRGAVVSAAGRTLDVVRLAVQFQSTLW